MINWQASEHIHKSLPRGLHEKVRFGHISYEVFSEAGKLWLEENYQELKNQKVDTHWNAGGPVYEKIGFYGELSNKIGNDLGVAAVWINDIEFILPQHFMATNELKKFIIKTTNEYFPELLI